MSLLKAVGPGSVYGCAVTSTRLTRSVFARRVALPRAHPSPRREVPRGGEDRHVGADLGEDDLGRAVVDTWDRGQQLKLGDERG